MLLKKKRKKNCGTPKTLLWICLWHGHLRLPPLVPITQLYYKHFFKTKTNLKRIKELGFEFFTKSDENYNWNSKQLQIKILKIN